MFKYNLAVFIKSLLLFSVFSSIIYAQETIDNQSIQSSQIYERIMFIEVPRVGRVGWCAAGFPKPT